MRHARGLLRRACQGSAALAARGLRWFAAQTRRRFWPPPRSWRDRWRSRRRWREAGESLCRRPGSCRPSSAASPAPRRWRRGRRAGAAQSACISHGFRRTGGGIRRMPSGANALADWRRFLRRGRSLERIDGLGGHGSGDPACRAFGGEAGSDQSSIPPAHPFRRRARR